jgi:NADH-quinone oxidoreductase subunit E
MTPEEVDGVATFYNLIRRRPVGRHAILLCTSVSCWVMGYGSLLRYFKEKWNIVPGQTTVDGRFTLLPNQCLGTCDHGPALMIDDDLHQDVDVEKLDVLLARYE